jgi:hypothetical protein
MKERTNMKWAVLTFALLSLASCQEKSLDPTLEGYFPEDSGEIRKPVQFADAMAASGARADAMLYAHHFDGAKLNSLGEQKLSLMLKDDDSPTPMTVYLNLKEKDAVSKQRQASVVTFLKDQGLADAQIEVIYGDNPASRSPAAMHISNLGKTDSSDAGGSVGAANPGQGGNSTPSAGGDAGSTVSTGTK